jgi:hypothetical protein
MISTAYVLIINILMVSLAYLIMIRSQAYFLMISTAYVLIISILMVSLAYLIMIRSRAYFLTVSLAYSWTGSFRRTL